MNSLIRVCWAPRSLGLARCCAAVKPALPSTREPEKLLFTARHRVRGNMSVGEPSQ